MSQRLRSGTMYSERMVCEPLLGFVLRHGQIMSLAMDSEARRRFVGVICRAVVDGRSFYLPWLRVTITIGLKD